MKKVYILPPEEDWIVDRFVKEWYEDNSDISVRNPLEADVIWLFADWCWKKIPFQILKSKKVITTVHHIVPEKFDKLEFMHRDQITDVYHVPNQHTGNFIKSLTKKVVHVIPYWANQKIWKSTEEKSILRKKYDLPINDYIIGSFQRDTEGSDLISPKLEKGPDLLFDFITNFSFKQKIFVLLAGWRRQYIINKLKNDNISFKYFEKPSQYILNDLYQTLDLYPITSRYEGGPQSIIECGLLNIPVISRNVGMATQVLPISSINDNICDAIPEVPNVESLKLPLGYVQYRNLIQST